MNFYKPTLKEFFTALFPRGNYRYYVMYFFFILVIGVMSVVMVTMMGILDNGNTIDTGTSVTHMDYEISHRIAEWVYPIITNLLNLYGYVMAILICHTAFSLIFDIAYKIRDFFIWADLINPLRDYRGGLG